MMYASYTVLGLFKETFCANQGSAGRLGDSNRFIS